MAAKTIHMIYLIVVMPFSIPTGTKTSNVSPFSSKHIRKNLTFWTVRSHIESKQSNNNPKQTLDEQLITNIGSQTKQLNLKIYEYQQ